MPSCPCRVSLRERRLRLQWGVSAVVESEREKGNGEQRMGKGGNHLAWVAAAWVNCFRVDSNNKGSIAEVQLHPGACCWWLVDTHWLPLCVLSVCVGVCVRYACVCVLCMCVCVRVCLTSSVACLLCLASYLSSLPHSSWSQWRDRLSRCLCPQPATNTQASFPLQIEIL